MMTYIMQIRQLRNLGGNIKFLLVMKNMRN